MRGTPAAKLASDMTPLTRGDFMAKSSQWAELLEGDRIEMRQKRNACAAFTSVPMLQTRSNYMPMPSGASSRKSLARFTGRDQALAGRDKNKKGGHFCRRQKKKTGHAPSRAPPYLSG